MLEAKSQHDEEISNNRILSPLSSHSIRSDNVNEELEKCLKSIKTGKRTYSHAHPSSNRHQDLISKKRLRKDQDTQKLLKREFIVGEPWNKEKICELSAKIGLKQSQIYKWNWDMIRKQ